MLITPEELHQIREALTKAEAELTWALQSYAPHSEGNALTEVLRRLHAARITAHKVETRLQQGRVSAG
jgi:ribosomal protein L16/L10AE